MASWSKLSALTAVVLFACSTLVAQSDTIELTPCGPEGAEDELLCGDLKVPEDPEYPSGRMIDLRVVVAPALEKREGAPAHFEIAGGPGLSVTADAEFFAGPGKSLRRFRDVVLVDQRGTGRSSPLRCPELEGLSPLEEMYPVSAVEACRTQLERTADLTQYTTAHSVRDLEAVRSALAYETIDLFAVSYGTELARAYMSSHPERVRRVLMIGAPPADSRTPLTHAANAQRALDLLFHECQMDDRCRQAYPDLRSDWKTMLQGVDEGLDVTIAASSGERMVRIHPGAFREALRGFFTTASGRRSLPHLVHAASKGNFAPFLEAIPRDSSMYSEGLYLSITCAEGTSRIDPAEIPAFTAGTFLSDYRVEQQRRACESWRIGDVPETLFLPVATKHPTLIIVGELDGTTPPEASRAICSNLENCQLLVVPFMGHVPFDLDAWSGGECLIQLMEDYFEIADPRDLRTGCVLQMEPPPFRTDAELPRARVADTAHSAE